MEEKYNQIDDENTSDNSEKSKTGQVTPEKKTAGETNKKDTEAASNAPSASKGETKEEEDQDSDHEDPHSNTLLPELGFSTDVANYIMFMCKNFLFLCSQRIIKWSGRSCIPKSLTIRKIDFNRGCLFSRCLRRTAANSKSVSAYS